MSIANRLLKLAALVALDKMMNKERSEELVKLLEDWKSERDKAKVLAEAKVLVADAENVAKAVSEVTGETDGVNSETRAAIEFAVASGITALEEPPTESNLKDAILPRSTKTFVVLSSDPRLIGGKSERFFHFYWDGESLTVRDFLEDRILHPPGTTRGDRGLKSEPLTMTPLEVWNASTVRIPSSVEFALGFGTGKQKEWKRVLQLLTEAGRQLRRK